MVVRLLATFLYGGILCKIKLKYMKKIINIPLFTFMAVFIVAALFLTLCKKKTDIPIQEVISNSQGIKKYGEAVDERKSSSFLNARVANFFHCGATGRIPNSELVIGESFHFRNYNGVAMAVNVERLRVGNSKIKSCWIAFYYHVTMPDGTIEQRWIQWGYAIHKQWGLIPAFYVYRINPTYVLAPLTINYINNNVPLSFGKTPVRFEIRNKPGTTFWICSRDGQDVLEVDLLTNIADDRLQVMTESWGDDTFSPVLNIKYMEALKNGAWNKIQIGIVDGYKPWNIEGQNQIPILGISEFNMGGLVKDLNAYNLWGQQ